MLKHGWISLNVLVMPENAWINCFDCVKFLNMPRYKYSNITVIVTVIILEFLSAWFVYPSALTRVRT